MEPDAAAVIAAAIRRQWLIATAESLTGGSVCEALVSVPGASAVVRGGVVAYAPDVKVSVLGVPQDMVQTLGPVSVPVATAMAAGARALMRAHVAVATTGVAGPEAHGGQAPGTVVIAVAATGVNRAETIHVSGDRDQVRAQARQHALTMLYNLMSA